MLNTAKFNDDFIEMFQLKRKQVQLESKYEGVAPCLVLLGLLAECCTVTTAQTQARTLFCCRRWMKAGVLIHFLAWQRYSGRPYYIYF